MASLPEKHRPQTLDEVVGQAVAVSQIRTVLARGWGGRAWWVTGNSGSGKTSLARIIAAHGADELGTEEVDAQWLTPAKIRDLEADMRFRNLGVKPGKAVIINEAHGIRKDSMRLLLTFLERLPEHCCIIFTTTKKGELSLFEDDAAGDAAPLLSRCIEVQLVRNDATDTAFAQRARKIAQTEGIDGLPLSVYERAVASSGGNLRRVLQRIESGAFKADAKAALEAEFEMVKSTKGQYGESRRAAISAALKAL